MLVFHTLRLAYNNRLIQKGATMKEILKTITLTLIGCHVYIINIPLKL